MTEHIDVNRLSHDLRYRFEYLSKFLNFTTEDIDLLNRFAPIVFPQIPVLADTVYRKLFSYDATKHYFLTNNEGFEGFTARKSNAGVTLECAQMVFRRDMLSMYLKRVLTQREWNESFLEYLSHIGKIHTNKAGSASINVDYVHINALLGFLEHLLIDALWTAEALDDQSRRATASAINKFFWIQNDFFTMHYLPNGSEKSKSSDDDLVKKTKYCCI